MNDTVAQIVNTIFFSHFQITNLIQNIYWELVTSHICEWDFCVLELAHRPEVGNHCFKSMSPDPKSTHLVDLKKLPETDVTLY